ncbi:hypothetical protein C8R44DRAFT_772810 [Mycena epipterygia]|nr:hypothetical protein C8R44DRAFT_772810 [Mycena epipterygia]
MNSTPPCVSFITILDFSARWEYLTESVSDLLGWEPSDLREHSFFELVHPDELSQVQQLHYETIASDKAAVVAYMRLKHKDAHKGYLLCAVVCTLHVGFRALMSPSTVVHDKVVGSISLASPGGKALHNSSTAQEITVITPSASNFEFRRWHDPRPITPPSPRSPTPRRSPSPLPAAQSPRTALILDRFSAACTITHYSNHHLILPAAATTRAFFDFVSHADETIVRSWLAAIKTCGVNDRGHPSGSGFGYGRFLLCAEGRDSVRGASEPPPPRRKLSHWRKDPSPAEQNEIPVDAIFSAHSDGLVCILRRAQ